MSFSHFEYLDKKRFTGISTVTSNAEEASGKGKIAAMWELFSKQNAIPPTSNVIALYSQYETYEHGTYSYSIGTFAEQCRDGEDVITLPAYMPSSLRGGEGLKRSFLKRGRRFGHGKRKDCVRIPGISRFTTKGPRIQETPRLPYM